MVELEHYDLKLVAPAAAQFRKPLVLQEQESCSCGLIDKLSLLATAPH